MWAIPGFGKFYEYAALYCFEQCLDLIFNCINAVYLRILEIHWDFSQEVLKWTNNFAEIFKFKHVSENLPAVEICWWRQGTRCRHSSAHNSWAGKFWPALCSQGWWWRWILRTLSVTVEPICSTEMSSCWSKLQSAVAAYTMRITLPGALETSRSLSSNSSLFMTNTNRMKKNWKISDMCAYGSAPSFLKSPWTARGDVRSWAGGEARVKEVSKRGEDAWC